jgi:hypothetical protein
MNDAEKEAEAVQSVGRSKRHPDGAIRELRLPKEEVEWVHQNYVVVVRTRTNGATVVRWEKAREKPPSMGAVRHMERAAANPTAWDRDVYRPVKIKGLSTVGGGGTISGDGVEGVERLAPEVVKTERARIAEMERVLGRLAEGL